MSSYNITEAKAQLSALVQKVIDDGEEVIISKAGRPVARMTRYEPAKQQRKLGLFQGQVTIAKDFGLWPDDIACSLGIID